MVTRWPQVKETMNALVPLGSLNLKQPLLTSFALKPQNPLPQNEKCFKVQTSGTNQVKASRKNLELYYTKIFLFQLYFKSSEEFGYSYENYAHNIWIYSSS